jgi:diguanylate cyclase (GGDEF)-like protein
MLPDRRCDSIDDRRQSSGVNFGQRVRHCPDCIASGAAQEDINAKLRQANEQLVMTSVKLQQANEELVIASVKMQAMAEQLKKSIHLASHDFLTDLPNRMQLFDRITQAIAWAKRHQSKFAVLFLDLDRFKIINDTLGHTIGDRLLQSVAERLMSIIRSSDTASRQGGDEFILVLSEVNCREVLALKVDEIRHIISAPYSIAGHELRIGVTIGVSIFPDDGDSAEILIRNADAAMYCAKENGRDQFQFFRSEMHIPDSQHAPDCAAGARDEPSHPVV